MKVYIEQKDMPKKCPECSFVNSEDACILQGDDANFNADSWDDLQKGCPLIALPDNIRDLLQAEKDGRLVVLPCKLHESIFYLEDGNWFEDIPYEVNLGERPGERKDSLLFTCEDGFNFYEDDIGKTVFLTPEEAEVAGDG